MLDKTYAYSCTFCLVLPCFAQILGPLQGLQRYRFLHDLWHSFEVFQFLINLDFACTLLSLQGSTRLPNCLLVTFSCRSGFAVILSGKPASWPIFPPSENCSLKIYGSSPR